MKIKITKKIIALEERNLKQILAIILFVRKKEREAAAVIGCVLEHLLKNGKTFIFSSFFT